MKLILAVLVMAASFMGCSGRKEKRAEYLANQQTRDSVFNEILNTPNYLKEFMDKAMNDIEAKNAIMQNRSFLKEVCMSGRMDSVLIAEPLLREKMTNSLVKIMAADSIVCDVTCTDLMKNEGLKKYLMNRSLKEMNSKAVPNSRAR
jgi:hypothetical protein